MPVQEAILVLRSNSNELVTEEPQFMAILLQQSIKFNLFISGRIEVLENLRIQGLKKG